MKQCAHDIKKLSLELGGNAPFLVFNEPDLDKAFEGAMIAKYRNSGQTCVCANRIHAQSGVSEAFAEKPAAATAKHKVGNGMQDRVAIGPLIDEAGLKKVEPDCVLDILTGRQIPFGIGDIIHQELGGPILS